MIYDVNVPNTIGHQTIIATTNNTAPPPTTVKIAKPVSYQFQVVEYTDGNDKVVKVELQVQQTEHDNNGNTIMSSGFKPVPRIRMPLP